ncbi:hypothetical protein BDN70DRAFT_893989 [Pholiota conissans]|uniref:Uncharacterized protein n=1 Tax=Pholiota conissans TaxID=109636 RepID=A0A9P6D1Q6_9AGAR|nr:hypothetical protein BDN70DRAFT_893989 [Pholiota conissans]
MTQQQVDLNFQLINIHLSGAYTILIYRRSSKNELEAKARGWAVSKKTERGWFGFRFRRKTGVGIGKRPSPQKPLRMAYRVLRGERVDCLMARTPETTEKIVGMVVVVYTNESIGTTEIWTTINHGEYREGFEDVVVWKEERFQSKGAEVYYINAINAHDQLTLPPQITTLNVHLQLRNLSIPFMLRKVRGDIASYSITNKKLSFSNSETLNFDQIREKGTPKS